MTSKPAPNDRPPIVLDYGTYIAVFRTISRFYHLLGFALGAALIAGGPGRFGAPGFAVARQLPGEQYTWGGLLAAAGLVGFCGSLARRVAILETALCGQVVWHGFFAVSLALSAINDGRAGLTGWVSYGGWALLGTLVLVALRQSGRAT
jgi:hypothetical protein